MVDRPILFSGPMVRAILEGRKTQTRRVIQAPRLHVTSAIMLGLMAIFRNQHTGMRQDIKGPCGVGDRLWVREAWCLGPGYNGTRIKDAPRHARVWYAADYPKSGYSDDYRGPGRGHPSIHMPRWASRLTLIVEDVRVQRVQEITYDDIVAEGAKDPFSQETAAIPGPAAYDAWEEKAQYAFMDLWDSLNAKRGYGWDENPWVVAITFRTIQQNIDRIDP